MGMGCGKKAVPEARGVAEGLCYSWGQDPWDTAPASRHVWIQGWEAFWIEQHGGCLSRSASCPSRPALLCAAGGWCWQDAQGLLLLESNSFPTGFVWPHNVLRLLPSPESHPASFGCWGVLGTGCGLTAENSFQGACSPLMEKCSYCFGLFPE